MREGPYAGAAPPLRAALPPPSPPRAAASTASLPPPPSQGGETALDKAKEKKQTEVVKLLENAPAIAAQVSAAPPSPLCTPPFA